MIEYLIDNVSKFKLYFFFKTKFPFFIESWGVRRGWVPVENPEEPTWPDYGQKRIQKGEPGLNDSDFIMFIIVYNYL